MKKVRKYGGIWDSPPKPRDIRKEVSDWIKMGLIAGTFTGAMVAAYFSGGVIEDIYKNYRAHKIQHENYQNLENQVSDLTSKIEGLEDLSN